MSNGKKAGKQDRKVSFVESAARELLIEGRWRWLIYILLFELWLAYSIPPTILSDVPLLRWLVNSMQLVTTGLGYFTPEHVPHPEAAQLYLAVTLLLVIPKVVFFFSWLNSDRMGIYRHLVISPLTTNTPSNPGKFITEPLHDNRKELRKQKPRSMFSRVFWSFLILAISALPLWMFVDPLASPNGGRLLYGSFALGGWSMWYGWVIKFLLIAPFYFAVCMCIIRDYFVFFGRQFSEISRGNRS